MCATVGVILVGDFFRDKGTLSIECLIWDSFPFQ